MVVVLFPRKIDFIVIIRYGHNNLLEFFSQYGHNDAGSQVRSRVLLYGDSKWPEIGKEAISELLDCVIITINEMNSNYLIEQLFVLSFECAIHNDYSTRYQTSARQYNSLQISNSTLKSAGG